MEATVNKQAAINGYEAFSAMDPEGAMKDISDSIEWVVTGNSSVSGTYRGKDDVGGFWMKLLEKGFTTQPQEFLAEGNKVIVLSEIELNGEKARSADVLTYDDAGKLVRFESTGGEELLDRAFPR
jgi:ketosteroid isomerase-like protein